MDARPDTANPSETAPSSEDSIQASLMKNYHPTLLATLLATPRTRHRVHSLLFITRVCQDECDVLLRRSRSPFSELMEGTAALNRSMFPSRHIMQASKAFLHIVLAKQGLLHRGVEQQSMLVKLDMVVRTLQPLSHK